MNILSNYWLATCVTFIHQHNYTIYGHNNGLLNDKHFQKLCIKHKLYNDNYHLQSSPSVVIYGQLKGYCISCNIPCNKFKQNLTKTFTA